MPSAEGKGPMVGADFNHKQAAPEQLQMVSAQQMQQPQVMMNGMGQEEGQVDMPDMMMGEAEDDQSRESYYENMVAKMEAYREQCVMEGKLLDAEEA